MFDDSVTAVHFLVVGGHALLSVCMPVLGNERKTDALITRCTLTDDRKSKISRHTRLRQSRTDISNKCVFDLRDWTDKERDSFAAGLPFFLEDNTQSSLFKFN